VRTTVDNNINHFVAYTFDQETQIWSLFNDSTVTEVDVNEVVIARRRALLAVYGKK